jgi:RNA polymerase sigma factor (sigma-70 family)
MESKPNLRAVDLIGHAVWLRRLARTLASDSPAADDAVQDTFVAALSRPPAVDRPMQPWLRVVLSNFLRRGHRTRVRAERRARMMAESTEPLPDAETLLAQHQALRLVAELIAELDEPLRSTILLCHGEGLAPTEVARRLGVPPGTVRWRLKTALDRLRGQLDERHGGDRRAWVLLLGGLGDRTPGGPPARGMLKPILASAVGLVVVGALLVGGARLRPRPGPRTVAREAARGLVHRSPARFVRAPSPPHTGTATVRGLVETRDGRPIPGAHVALFAPPLPTSATQPSELLPVAVTASGPDGRFELRAAPGAYGVTATAPGFAPAHLSNLRVAQAGQPPLALVLAPGGVTVRGRVLEPSGGPVGGALVAALVDFASFSQLDLTRLFVAVTDADGRYRLGLPGGSYSLLVTADGYGRQLRGLLAYADEVRDFRLRPPGQLAGRSIRKDGSPVPEAVIELGPLAAGGEPNQTRADRAGAFSLDVPPGRYRVTARSGGMVALSREVEVLELERTEGVVLELERGRVIEGQVRPPAAGLELDLIAPDGSWQRRPDWVTDRAGRFRFEALAPGRYTVRVHEGGQDLGGEAAVDVTGGDAGAVALSLAPTTTLRGRVLDDAGAPVAGAQVLTWPVNAQDRKRSPVRRAATDANGAFVLRGLPAGAINVGAEQVHRGVIPQLTRADLVAGTAIDVTLRLGPGVAVRGEVRGADGQPAAGVLVRAFSSVAPRSTWTDQAGHFLLEHVPSSDVLVLATAEEVEVDPWRRSPGPDLAALQIRKSVTPPPVSLTLPRR